LQSLVSYRYDVMTVCFRQCVYSSSLFHGMLTLVNSISLWDYGVHSTLIGLYFITDRMWLRLSIGVIGAHWELFVTHTSTRVVNHSIMVTKLCHTKVWDIIYKFAMEYNWIWRRIVRMSLHLPAHTHLSHLCTKKKK
jgi:hypothetical protein